MLERLIFFDQIIRKGIKADLASVTASLTVMSIILGFPADYIV